MRILVKKMSTIGLLKFELIGGAIFMTVACLGLPIGLFALDVTLMANPYVWCVVLGGMLFFGLVGYFCWVRPYILYHKYPAVQVETDGEFLYIHTKKEAKIPLSEIEQISLDVNLPYLLQASFAREFIIHMFSEEYGDIDLEILGYGTYKMRFVSHAEDTMDDLYEFLTGILNQNS